MIYIYGWMAIACAFLLGVFVPMILVAWRQSPLKTIWQDRYFWLLAGATGTALGVGEFAVSRIYQTLIGTVKFGQPESLAVFAALTAGVGALCKMRAVVINSPRTARLFLLLCAAWAVFAAIWGIS